MIHRWLDIPPPDGRKLTYCGQANVQWVLEVDDGVDCKDCLQEMRRIRTGMEWARWVDFKSKVTK